MPPDRHLLPVCASSPKTNIYASESFLLTGSASLKGLNWSDTFGPKRAAPTVGGLLCRDIHISVAEIMHPLFLFVALRLFRDVVASKRIIYKKEPGVSIAERPDSAEQR